MKIKPPLLFMILQNNNFLAHFILSIQPESSTLNGILSLVEITPCRLDSRIWDVCTLNRKIYSRVESTNKSELLNCLTYRGLIYIFEVGTKTFRPNCQFSRPISSKKLTFKSEKRPYYFFWGWRLIFLALKPFLQCH